MVKANSAINNQTKYNWLVLTDNNGLVLKDNNVLVSRERKFIKLY